MRAGPLRHLCMLRGITSTQDELNQPVKGWADIGKVWAEIKAPSGRMYEAASQMQAQINAEINIRYRKDVVAGQRLVHDGITYEIIAPLTTGGLLNSVRPGTPLRRLCVPRGTATCRKSKRPSPTSWPKASTTQSPGNPMIETSLIDRLSPLVDGRVYFGVAPEGAALPRLILQTVSEGAGFTLTGWDGSSDLSIQVDAWGASHFKALTLARQAFAAMTTDGDDFTTGSADRLPDAFEDDTELFSVSWEYTLQP